MIENASGFFAAWREQFGSLSQKEVEGINALLAEMEGRGWSDRRWWAYVLATAWHETAATMAPINEYGGAAYFTRMYDLTGNSAKARELGNTKAGDGARYHGRGFVMITGRANYRKLGARLGIDLEANPDLALEATPAAEIMCEGMQHGLFTGKSLGDYFDADTNDPVNARRIVNGTDKAALIAGYHAKALACIEAGWGEPKPVDRVAELEAENADLAARLAAIEAWAATVNVALDRLENRNA